MITAGSALYHDRRLICCKCLHKQWTAKPPKKNQQWPFKKMLVFWKPQPNPCKIRKAVTHRHPKQYPKQTVSLRNTSCVANQMKDSVIHKHINNSHYKADKHGHIFLFIEQKTCKHCQKRNIQPYIHRHKLPPCNQFCHNIHHSFLIQSRYFRVPV